MPSLSSLPPPPLHHRCHRRCRHLSNSTTTVLPIDISQSLYHVLPLHWTMHFFITTTIPLLGIVSLALLSTTDISPLSWPPLLFFHPTVSLTIATTPHFLQSSPPHCQLPLTSPPPLYHYDFRYMTFIKPIRLKEKNHK